MLTRSTQTGKTSVIHGMKLTLTSSTIATAYVNSPSKRGITPVRTQIVAKTNMNVPAMRIE